MMASLLSPAKESELESTKGPNWLELPINLTTNILQRLHIIDIVTSACLVCPLWWNICKDPLMWRSIDMSCYCRYPRWGFYLNDLEKICIYAVERSCGHLEDIHIKGFASDDLLKCLADRVGHLRRLSLVRCSEYSDKGFCEFVEKLPMLEELDMSYSYISKVYLEAIGRFCPLLKLLKFEVSNKGEVFYVAKSMPGLRRIEISRSLITNEELLAIVDGCPFLEYLDVHTCYCVDWSSSLENMCRERIKDFVLPSHYVDDDSDSDSDDDSYWDIV